jgi:hypothetical protein
MRCRSDVSRAFAYFHFLERPATKIGGAGDHCHPGAPSRMPSSRQLNGDCSISPRFHFRCRARPRSQIVPNGRPRLNAFMKGLAPRIRTNDRYCPRTSARCLHHPGGSGKKCPTSLGTNGSGCRQDAGPALPLDGDIVMPPQQLLEGNQYQRCELFFRQRRGDVLEAHRICHR